ncbi:hypothetical protein NCG89_03970 [Spongiibacter taiwanensis]|uniref:hypothetical protein n=1 Tax=Spongiibacter taiwanensis TaxID=1748242 RepID=UPI002035C24B|nr:hypothetical protein [Spongiibacter taiwanensis]USA43949.1 hypothetical protein NCG89_03970 [Spongiibacter taiwanensis]
MHPFIRQGFAWVLCLALLPIIGIAAVWLAAWLGYLFGWWTQSVAAVVVPLVVLPSTYFLAPRFRHTASVIAAAILFALALQWLWPSYYPAWHPRAYQPTYLPMRLFCVTNIVLLMPLAWPANVWMFYQAVRVIRWGKGLAGRLLQTLLRQRRS